MEQEIDLLNLFNKIRNSITQSSKKIILYILRLVFKYKYLYLVLVIIGTIFASLKMYRQDSQTIISSAFEIKIISSKNIEYLFQKLDYDLQSQNYISLESKIAINADTIKTNILSIKTSKELIKRPDERKLVEGKLISIPVPPLEINTINILLVKNNEKLNKLIQSGLLKYINNNKYIQKKILVYTSNKTKQIKRLKTELEQIDKFQERMLNNDKFRTIKIVNDKFLLGDTETYENKIISLSNKIIELENSLIEIEPLAFVSNFSELPHKSKLNNFSKMLIMYLLISFLLSLGIDFLLYLKKLRVENK